MNFVISVGRSGRLVSASQLKILHQTVTILILMIIEMHMNDIVIDKDKDNKYTQVMTQHLKEKDQLMFRNLLKNDLERRRRLDENQVQVQVNINHSKSILYRISTFILIFTSSSL